MANSLGRALPVCGCLLSLAAMSAAQGAGRAPQVALPAEVVQGDFTIPNYHFDDGESLPELKLHYRTLGTPRRDAAGVVRNAVLILHGTGGTGTQFLSGQFAGVLFVKGGLLDASQYYLILPDGIGHGQSSKPSDGLKAQFPHYGYHDMVRAEHQLLTEKLGVNHLRLVMGTSMGGMQSWMWAEMYPDMMEAAMPLASLPVEIAGRNRQIRKMIEDSIVNSPDYDQGNYTQAPSGMRTAVYLESIMTSSPKDMQTSMPTAAQADAALQRTLARLPDANDMLYQFLASADYNPAPELENIQCRLMAVNSADDQVNPPEVGAEVMVPNIKRVPHGEYILIPIGPDTRGHGTHTIAKVWKDYLAKLLQESAQPGD